MSTTPTTPTTPGTSTTSAQPAPSGRGSRTPLTARKTCVGTAGLALAGAYLLAAPGIATADTLPAACQADSDGTTVTCTYDYTGDVQEFDVPDGVTEIDVTAVGGHGGSGYEYGATSSGGQGARVSGAVAVPTADTLYVYVGGDGHDADGSPGAAGWNGGAHGGGGQTGGGGGGGASDLRTTKGDLTTRLIVAAGGGGGGANTDADGGDSWTTTPTVYDGKPGGDTDGGAGGAYRNYHGADGQLGSGGNGTWSGGGGGGGYYGGGGGTTPAGGGGGGSSMLNGTWLVPADSPQDVYSPAGDDAPSITITYLIPEDQGGGDGGLFSQSLASLEHLFDWL